MLVGVHIPRFDLAVAAHEHGVPMGGAPLALAPLDGGAGPIGEVSPAAAASGVRPGMRTAQAHALCPALRLVPPDPLAVRLRADRLYIALEGIGAAVEPVADGLALLDARPLERLWNGLDGVLRRERRGRGARDGPAPAPGRRARPVPDDARRAPGTAGQAARHPRRAGDRLPGRSPGRGARPRRARGPRASTTTC